MVDSDFDLELHGTEFPTLYFITRVDPSGCVKYWTGLGWSPSEFRQKVWEDYFEALEVFERLRCRSCVVCLYGLDFMEDPRIVLEKLF